MQRSSDTLLGLSHGSPTPRSRTRLLDVAAGKEGSGSGGGEMSHRVKVTSRPCASLRAGGADLSSPSRPHGRPQVCLTWLLLHRLLSAPAKPALKTAASRHFGAVTTLVSRPWDKGPLGFAEGHKKINK